MSKSYSLDKKAKKVILLQMEELGEITTEDVMELLRPHFTCDLQKLREQALRKNANNLMRSYKDEKGIRTCFNRKTKDGESSYVNVDKTTNLEALKDIELQLNKKYKGLNKSKKKIVRRYKELSGQISIEDVI